VNVSTYILELKTTFVFEKRTKLYQKYSEKSIAKEKVVLNQEPFRRNPELLGLTGKGGM